VNQQASVVTAFVGLVRRTAARLPHVALIACPRCLAITRHRVASETSLGETVWRCERCGMMVSQ
jgi:uncharacterized C2H2 Zn-finger protein